jgi:hypothetical protein
MTEEELDDALRVLFSKGLIAISATDKGVGYIPTPAGIAVVEANK